MQEEVEALLSRPTCESVVNAWEAVVSDDLDSLGDNSPSVIASLQDQRRPWSWRVYAYKKKQVCNSELYFMRPAFARDTQGEAAQLLLSSASVLSVFRGLEGDCPELQGGAAGRGRHVP